MSVRMTRGHFQLIAEALSESMEVEEADQTTIRLVAIKLANRLRSTNPTFDRHKFLSACEIHILKEKV